MRLFRICCDDEIDAIKNDDPVRLFYGAPLYKYIKDLSTYANDYPCYNKLWNEYMLAKSVQEERVKPILKVFDGLPLSIPLFEKNVEKRKELLKKYTPNVSRLDPYPIEVEDLLRVPEFDFVFVATIKVAGFFANPFYHKMRDGISDLEAHIIAIDFPSEIAVKYQGTGEYNRIVTEYALPMYMLKSAHVLDSYQRFSDTDENFRNDFLKEQQKKSEIIQPQEIKNDGRKK